MKYKCNNCGHEGDNQWVKKDSTGNYKSREWLFEQYVTHRKSMDNIASQCNVTSMTINNWLKRFDIKTRGRGVRSGLFDI